MIICTLNQLMKEKDITQSKISDDTGITRPTLLSLIRNDNQSIRYETINQLCKFFSIDMSELLVYSPVEVKLEHILVEKFPLMKNDNLDFENYEYIVSVIYNIDGHEFEFDTNLTVNNTSNTIENSKKIFFSSLVYEDIWKSLKFKKFDEDFIKIYNDSINLEEKIKNELKTLNLNTDFEFRKYDIEINTMKRSHYDRDEAIEKFRELTEKLPESDQEKELMFSILRKALKNVDFSKKGD
ncbi:helix-turn-helix transcriptional regulator [Mammaliicoccus sciuri]|uniref:helix-turn-helix domain-containing protein n=2 Tax=Mammaliicoccus sciuri TaxID=1296 RepID=UPI0019D3B57E|nr:helix-turn-helix transcriptional regulator [Mammaliicoccus sciuri]QSN68554.1 helix-turn-helix transcriptional regulator [Mammaliicoccus sciuri]UIU23298.1 helix-turn-helix transcriptional regulator [Mammaliicoccus sciuri]UIU26204.1 helix-turn-helix transcriptional regulator [Mammaliicoccus sciuri]